MLKIMKCWVRPGHADKVLLNFKPQWDFELFMRLFRGFSIYSGPIMNCSRNFSKSEAFYYQKLICPLLIISISSWALFRLKVMWELSKTQWSHESIALVNTDFILRTSWFAWCEWKNHSFYAARRLPRIVTTSNSLDNGEKAFPVIESYSISNFYWLQ